MLRKRFLFILTGLVALSGVAWIWNQSLTKDQPAPRSPLISPIDGPALLKHVRDLKSPLVMVNFWASWCGPCEEEMPHLLEAYKKAEAKGFKLVLVSIDEPSDLEAANNFLQSAGVNFQSYYKGNQPPMFIQSLYPDWQGSVPATLLYGPDLKLLEAWEGSASIDELEQRISRHLASIP